MLNRCSSAKGRPLLSLHWLFLAVVAQEDIKALDFGALCVVDECGNTMIFKQVATRSYFISSDREKFRTHKMRYPVFEHVMLRLLDDIDFAALALAAAPIEEEQKHHLNDILAQIIEVTRLRKRYLRVIEGEEE